MTDVLFEHIKSLEEPMLGLLKELVLIQSGTHNKAGLDQMAGCVFRTLADIPMNAQILPQDVYGNMVVARSDRALQEKVILLVGHMDTVFPQDTDFNYFRQDQEKIYGPGVMDMKGGLVVGFFALRALSDLGLLRNIPVIMFCNSEEEIGSPASRTIIEKLAAESRAAIVLEGGGPQRQLVVGRKGKIGLDLAIRGRAGHAGTACSAKPSAVLEAAHKTISLEKLNNPPEILVNVGCVKGGMGPNSIAEQALLGVDVRFTRSEDEQDLFERIRDICETNVVEGTTSQLILTSRRPPMKTDQGVENLYQVVHRAAHKLGVVVSRETRGGVSDANFIAAMGIPVLDGLGPCGDLDHSCNEYIIKKTMVERTALLAQAIIDVQQGF